MYESFFNLTASPFPATPIVANYFPCAAIESARQSFVRVVERAEGPGLLIGPAGVGKSLLLRVLAERFREQFRVILLSEARIFTRKSLLQCILFELGVMYRGLDEGELRLALIDALRPGAACPHGILLLIDEAHALSARLLDEIRMITNVVRDGSPRARLVLAGGPRLEERFANPKVESLNQRVAARCCLQSLTREETYEYVRAQLAGVGGDPDAIFGDDAIRAVYQASDGIPRLINQVCDHALLLAGTHGIAQLDAELIQEAWADLQQLPPPWQATVAEHATTKATVIEFGELDEDDTTASGDAGLRCDDVDLSQDAAHTSSYGDECLEPDPTCDRIDQVVEMPESVIIGVAGADAEIEWFDGGQSVPLDAGDAVEAADPFDAPFDEEVVVIDRNAVSEIEAFRGRQRVSCSEGRKMHAELAAVRMGSPQPKATAFGECAIPGSASAGIPLFEFSTLGAIAVDSTAAATAPPSTSWASHEWDDATPDFDEQLESVPLPWARGTLGDDRDVIIIEEDLAAISAFAAPEGSEQPRKMEYRELFAQLRRASS